jgi:hypothetical protein
MLAGFEEFPLGLDFVIGFQFRVGFCLEDVMAYIDFIEFVHQQGIDTFPLEVGPDRDQAHFYRIVFSQNP